MLKKKKKKTSFGIDFNFFFGNYGAINFPYFEISI